MSIGSKVKEKREAAGLSQEQLAARAGTSQSTIQRIEHDGFKRPPPVLAKVAVVLDIPPTELHPDLVFFGGHGQVSDQPDFIAERDLKVFAAVEGGDGEMVVSTDPIEIVPRPWYMHEVRDGYAVLVVGESMIPAFEPGDMAVINPRLPPMRNKNTIFIGGEKHGEFRARIKRLVGWTNLEWRVRQFNPPKNFKLNRDDWPKALRVVGKYEGH